MDLVPTDFTTTFKASTGTKPAKAGKEACSGLLGKKPLVSIGIGKEGVRIDDSLVIHQLILLVLGEGVQFIGFGIPHDLVGFDDLGLAWFQEGFLDFVEDVLSHDVIVQLALAFAVEAEPSHLAFNVTKLGLVAIVLGARRHEFRNVVVGIQFTREVAEVIAQDRVGLAFLAGR